jgi:hypothetical protein
VPYKAVPNTNLFHSDTNIIGFYDETTVYILTPVLVDYINKNRNAENEILSAKELRDSFYKEKYINTAFYSPNKLTISKSFNGKRSYFTAFYKNKIEEFIGKDL